MQSEPKAILVTGNRDDSDDDRHSAIAKAAYQRAHARNFEPGGELEDWLSAEREVDGE